MTLVAIKSCNRDRRAGFHKAIRETWAKNFEIRFFVGNGDYSDFEKDEVYLDVPDDYMSLPYKTKAILEWFLDTSYEHVFLADNDTYVLPSTFTLGHERADYAGKISLWPRGATVGQTFRYNDGKGNTIDPCYPWASGGYGYFLSRKAAEAVVKTEPSSWAEDLWVGQVLGPLTQSGEIKTLDLDLHNKYTWHWNKPYAKAIAPDNIREAYRNGKPAGREWSVVV
jgi:hypothetical protein